MCDKQTGIHFPLDFQSSETSDGPPPVVSLGDGSEDNNNNNNINIDSGMDGKAYN